LVVNTVNASHHVGAGGCSRQEIWLSSSSWAWTYWWQFAVILNIR
jgi:hypothetical protein